MKRRLLVILLTFAIILSCVSVCFGAGKTTAVEMTQAGILKTLHLFKGVSDTEFALYRAPTRPEALVMLIRLLGAEEDALNYEGSHPFTDVPKWCDKYVAYAYGNGLTKGTSATTFGTGNANAAMYTTFVLRSLGYSDSVGADFSYSKAVEFARSAGFDFSDINVKNFQRADVVKLSFDALRMKGKGSKDTLAEKLLADGVFTAEEYRIAMAADTTRIQLPETAPNGVSYAEMAKVYCGDSNLSYIVNPKTDEDYRNNFLYCYLTGNWEFNSSAKIKSVWEKKLGGQGEYASIYVDLIGEYLNCFHFDAKFTPDGKCIISTGGVEPIFTQPEMHAHIIEAYEAAVAMRDSFHKDVDTSKFTTEYQLARAYYEYMYPYLNKQGFDRNWEPNDTYDTDSSPQGSMINITADGLYPILVRHHGMCGARAAVYNVLMHLEGIEAYGLCGEGTGGGHIISLVNLDGKDYCVDWGNRRGIKTIEEAINDKSDHFIPAKMSIDTLNIIRFQGNTALYTVCSKTIFRNMIIEN